LLTVKQNEKRIDYQIGISSCAF